MVSVVTNFFWCVVGFLQTYNGAVTAVATVFIGVFTWVLARVTNRQARLTRESIDLARQEFIASHRPKLRIRRMTPNLPLLPDDPIGILIEVANIGDTKATIFEVGIDVYVQGNQPNAAPLPHVGSPIPAGMEASMMVSDGRRLSEAEIDAVEVGTLELRLLGAINYRDDNGTIRGTSFARLYDRTLRRFVKVPEHDQEADREYEN